MNAPRIGYRSLRERTRAWVHTRLWAQVLIALGLGVSFGTLLGPDFDLVPRPLAFSIATWLALPGKLFLGLIGMVLVPLVAASIILGLGGAASGEQLKRVGGRLAIYIGATTTLAATLGIVLASIVRPGTYVSFITPMVPRTKPDLTAAPETAAAGAKALGEAGPPAAATLERLEEVSEGVTQTIVSLIPQNVTAAIVNQEMLAIVLFSIFVGVAFVTAEKRQSLEPLARLLEALLEISMTVVKWAMFLTPYAVFGLMVQLVAQVGFSTILGMGVYVATVLAGLLVLLLLFAGLAAIFGKMAPSAFARAIAPVQLLAFSTSSSAAVMPLSIQTAVDKLGVPANVASLVVPLGATVNMAGTALYQAVAVVFLAQIAGMELNAASAAMVVVTLVASSIGAPGTPGVGVVILASIAGSFSIPTTGLVLVLGVDRVLDMARTVVNVTGDLAACRILRGLSDPMAPLALESVKAIPPQSA